jgi:hypothetical protein
MPFDPHPMIGTWQSLTSKLVESVTAALEAYRHDSPPSAPSLAKVRTTHRRGAQRRPRAAVVF